MAYSYDDRHRLTHINAPAGAPQDISFGYDVMGRQTSVYTGWHTNTFAYDILGRVTSEATAIGTVSYEYDGGGRRTKMTWPDNFYVTYDYNGASELTAIKENGSATLASYDYDDLGRREKVTRGSVATTDYAYDNKGRLDRIEHKRGSTSEQQIDFDYNDAGQITKRLSSNSAYDWTGYLPANVTTLVNSLNQATQVGAATTTHDSRGNMTNANQNPARFDFADYGIIASRLGRFSLSAFADGRQHDQ